MTWSYSRLTCFERCPYEFFLHYILSLPEESMFYSSFGSFIHHIYAEVYSGRLTPEDAVPYYIACYRRHVTPRPPSEKIGQSFFSQGLEAVRNLYIPPGITEVEYHCNFTVGKYPFTGFIDVAFRDEQGDLCIADHKSHPLRPRSARAKPTKGDEELDAYLRQLYLYSEAWRQLRGETPKYLLFNCYRTGTLIREPWREEKHQQALDWAASTVEKITSNTNWPPAVDFFQCNQLCGCHHNCEYYN